MATIPPSFDDYLDQQIEANFGPEPIIRKTCDNCDRETESINGGATCEECHWEYGAGADDMVERLLERVGELELMLSWSSNRVRALEGTLSNITVMLAEGAHNG